MKVKTITCHEVYNYGASLQEYALLKFLKNQGHQTETIHYKPPYLSQHFKLWVEYTPLGTNFVSKLIFNTLKLPKRLLKRKRKKEFDAFSEKFIKSTQKLYRSNSELINDVPHADVYICGSDQIWNSFFENGKDPSFYLDFVPDGKLKISYAASFAIDQIEDSIKDFVTDKVSKIDHISVRESSGKRILENLNITNVTQVLDPVFLLEEKNWINLMDSNWQKTISSKGKYLVVYDFDSDPIIKKLALKLKNEYGWEIYAFNEMINYADKNLFLEGPQIFLSILKNAECILANSFHAVAFSIIFKKNFAVFNRRDKINTRMRDLLQSVGLGHLLLLDDNMAMEYKLNTIDYLQVDSNLNTHIKRSKNFLIKALEN